MGSNGFRARVRLFAALAFALCAVMVAPQAARAGDYSMTGVDIQAVVEADGTLAVRESRTFAFDDEVNGVFWEIPEGDNQQGAASSVQVQGVSVDRGDGERAFSQASSAQAGEDGVFTVSQEDGTERIQVFMPSDSDSEARVTVSYVLSGAVMAWPDTAELYWKFIGPAWEESSKQVHLTVTFAGEAASGVAASAGAQASDPNLRAWAHGPLDGTVSIDAGTTSQVTFEAPEVESGQFAEARIAFPAVWVPGLAVSGSERLPTILQEEQAWADEANAQRERARVLLAAGSVVQVVLPALLLAGVLFVRATKYRTRRPVFQETYFRDVPSADHPAVLSAFMNNGVVEDRAFVATLMRLTDNRAVALERTVEEKRGLFGSKRREAYTLVLLDPDRAEGEIDRRALDLYFGTDAEAGARVAFDGLHEAAEDDPERMGERIDDFKTDISAELERRSLVSLVSAGYTVGAMVLIVLFAAGSLFFSLAMDFANMPAFIASAVLLAAAMLAVSTTTCYTQEATELRERCAALKRWLEDFTNLDEAVPSDLILWNKLLVMAVALGVSDEVLRRLADAVPHDLRGDEEMGYYYPIYWWCYPHGSLGTPASEMHTAYHASVSELASSASSSGGGFGGGFSGGGGGGVGGGGGGTF